MILIGYPSAAKGRIYPTSVLASKRDSILFICNFANGVKWTFKGKSLPINSKVISSPPNNKLIIYKVTSHNHGKYVCEGKTGTNVHFMDIAYLLVKGESSSIVISIN